MYYIVLGEFAGLFYSPVNWESFNAQQELFNPGTGTTVEGISELAIMEALSELQIFNEVRKKK